MRKEAVGKKLIQLRGERSREEVAKEVQISVSALQMYENGQRMPKDGIKIRLANFFNTTVQHLFFEEEPHEMCGDNTEVVTAI